MTKPEREMLNIGVGRLHRMKLALRLEAERAALARVRASGRAPESCGPEMPVAPGRGKVLAVRTVSFVPKGRDGWRAVEGGFDGRDAGRKSDGFDAILAAAARAKAMPPLTPGQVAIGRRYRDLAERLEAGGVKCSDLDGRGGGGDGFMDAYLADARELARMRARIGHGSALAVRRLRPSARGSRRGIADRVLVDMVCLEGASLSEVLRRHGWTKQTPQLKALLVALCGALDRMIGYRGLLEGS